MKSSFQTAYSKVKKPKIDCGESLTEQGHKKECDMNYILKDYQRTGLIKHAKENKGRYDDVSPIDFQEAMLTVANARNMFEELPSNMRKRFANDPARFLDFVQNPANADEMRELGILKGNDGIDISGAVTGAPVESGASVEATELSKANSGASGEAGKQSAAEGS
jgi:phage internal scaffolding protein